LKIGFLGANLLLVLRYRVSYTLDQTSLGRCTEINGKAVSALEAVQQSNLNLWHQIRSAVGTWNLKRNKATKVGPTKTV